MLKHLYRGRKVKAKVRRRWFYGVILEFRDARDKVLVVCPNTGKRHWIAESKLRKP